VLDDPRWPLARPYRRLTAEPTADIPAPRDAPGVRETARSD
jgi:hypothetical protein